MSHPILEHENCYTKVDEETTEKGSFVHKFFNSYGALQPESPSAGTE